MIEYTMDDARALVDSEAPASSPQRREELAQKILEEHRRTGESAERILEKLT